MGRRAAILWGGVLVAIGLVFLADTLSGGTLDAGRALARWWPLLVIILGAAILVEAALPRGRPVTRELALDLGPVSSAEIRIDFGAGRLTVGPADEGRLVQGTFEGGMRYQQDGAGRVRIWTDPGDAWWGAGWHGFDWRIGLVRDRPLALWIQCGASDNDLDLSELQLTSLHVRTGAAETVVRLPRAAGQSIVQVESGAASVRLIVPPDVAARIASEMAIGTVHVDQRRFPQAGRGWASPDYATAANRVDITHRGGVGSLRVD